MEANTYMAVTLRQLLPQVLTTWNSFGDYNMP